MMYKAELVFVRLLLPLTAGIVGFTQIGLNTKGYVVAATVLLCVLIVLNLMYSKLKMHRKKGLIGMLIYLLTFFLGALSISFHKQSESSSHFSKHQCNYLKLIVDGEPQKKGNIIRTSANVVMAYRNNKQTIDNIRVTGRILIIIRVDSLQQMNLNYGDEILVSARFTDVEPPYNPSEFDVRFWLMTQNISHQAFLKQPQIKKLREGKGNSILNYALQLRQEQVSTYRRLIKNDEAFAVASTLVLGYRADLNTETLNAYSKTGTIHALSVSGMHVGLIYIILSWSLAFMQHNPMLRFFKLLFILGLICFYSLITGFCPSVLRSAIMLSVFIVSKYIHKSTNSYNVLAFSAFCLLLYNPFFLWDVGFQLSFISVFGLVYLQPKLYKRLYFSNKLLDKLWGLISLSLSAQLVTFPLSVYYFHQFPLYFLAGNLFISIPVAVLMYLGLAILLFRLYFLGFIFEWIINFTNEGLSWIAKLPFSTVNSIWISKIELLLLCAALLLLMTAFNLHYKKLLFMSVFSFTGFYLLLGFDKIHAQRQRKIIFFSLKRNYATAFINGEKAIVITDLQIPDKSFAFFIRPALDQHKITDIKVLPWNTTFKKEGLEIDSHKIIFHQYNILKFDAYFKGKLIKNKPKFDLLWLHNNPDFRPGELSRLIEFNTVVADASNKPYKLKYYTDSINLFQIPYHVLKKNKGYLIDLTHQLN